MTTTNVSGVSELTNPTLPSNESKMESQSSSNTPIVEKAVIQDQVRSRAQFLINRLNHSLRVHNEPKLNLYDLGCLAYAGAFDIALTFPTEKEPCLKFCALVITLEKLYSDIQSEQSASGDSSEANSEVKDGRPDNSQHSSTKSDGLHPS